jgi:hypothetical protein
MLGPPAPSIPRHGDGEPGRRGGQRQLDQDRLPRPNRSPDSVVVLDTDFSAGSGRGALIRVDLASGNRTLLSDDATPSGGQQFDNPIDVRYNSCEKAFYVLQTGFTPATPADRVLKVDAATGARMLFASYLGAENYALLLRPIPVQLP